MSVLTVRLYGDPVLRQKAQAIGTPSPELSQLAADMAETMYANDGIGLAANQVGILKRIVVVDASDEYARSKHNGKRTKPEQPQYEVLIDPQIIRSSPEDCEYNEGCLSIPGIEGKIYRPATIRVRWHDLQGATHEEDIADLRARVFQHEIDHLDGILFVDHMPTPARARIAGKLNLLRQQTEAALPQEEDCD